ncbi:MAG: hypothetical protein O8C61_00095 [Candidatus Methanoperedens sp.]|nr:hypothetical protein [Candidatus Methanoperedens sp.]
MQSNTKINLIGIYLTFFLLTLTVAPLIVYFSNLKDPLIKSLIYIGSSGGLGGTIYCIRGFYQNLGENNFKFNWTWWYIFRPLISVVIGVVVYFIIVGGLLSLGSVSEVNYSKSVMFYCAVSFLAGFSFTQFADKLEDLSSTLFSKKKEDNK